MKNLTLNASTDPIAIGGHLNTVLSVLYSDLNKLIKNNERLLLHHEEVGDTVGGTLAGYLVWNGFIESVPEAITKMEKTLKRVIGPTGREIASASTDLPTPEEMVALDEERLAELEAIQAEEQIVE